jgi:hypothetical protein
MSETRSVVSLRVALAHFSELSGNGFNPMVTRLSYPFATSPLRAKHLSFEKRFADRPVSVRFGT